MICQCGGGKEVKLSGNVALTMCTVCQRGEFIPQPKPSEVFDFRARVSALMEAQGVTA